MPYSIGSYYNYIVLIDPEESLEDNKIGLGSPQSSGGLEFSKGFMTGNLEDIFQDDPSLMVRKPFLYKSHSYHVGRFIYRKTAFRAS